MFPIHILQHPQESRESLRTAEILKSAWPETQVHVGLSWRNLGHVFGLEPNTKGPEGRSWGVLSLPGRSSLGPLKKDVLAHGIYKVRKHTGMMVPEALVTPPKGLLVLDGSWAQVKTLWWRNPWITKLERLILFAPTRSAYDALKRESRPECLSTYESTIWALLYLGKISQSEHQAKIHQFSQWVGSQEQRQLKRPKQIDTASQFY